MDSSDFYTVGESYFIRTAVFHYTGKLERANDSQLILSSCAWIADSGRFADALRDGSFSEVEPYPAGTLVCIERASIVDGHEWRHPLPVEQK